MSILIVFHNLKGDSACAQPYTVYCLKWLPLFEELQSSCFVLRLSGGTKNWPIYIVSAILSYPWLKFFYRSSSRNPLQLWWITIWSSFSFFSQVPFFWNMVSAGNTSRGKGCITDKLEELKQQSCIHSRSELEHKVVLQYCKVKSFGMYILKWLFTAVSLHHGWLWLWVVFTLFYGTERWKIEHSIWWVKEQKRASDDNPQWLADPTEQLIQLKEDLEYVQVLVVSICTLNLKRTVHVSE